MALGSSLSTGSAVPGRKGVAKDPLATKFGIEFEFAIAFHDDKFKRSTEIFGPVAVETDLTPAEHNELLRLRDLGMAGSQRSHFPSWAVKETDANRSAVIRFSQDYPLGLIDCGLRRYFMEPLLISQDVLQASNCPTEVIGLVTRKTPVTYTSGSSGITYRLTDSQIDYTKWTLTTDLSLIGATKDEIYRALNDRMTWEERTSWDSWGVELVSRIFRYDLVDNEFGEIHRYLSTLRHGSPSPRQPDNSGARTSGALTSIFAGTHVHVGLKIDDMRQLKSNFGVLQHIGYITVAYEDLLTQLHPYHRSGRKYEPGPLDWSSAEPYLQREDSESDAHWAERTAKIRRDLHTGFHEVNSNVAHLVKVLKKEIGREPCWMDVRNTIFDSTHEEDLDIFSFLSMMQEIGISPSRAFFINWSNLYERARAIKEKGPMRDKKPTKPTIEFRQHACSLDAVEMRHWVDLLFAIVGLAQNKRDQVSPMAQHHRYAEREGSKYPKNRLWHPEKDYWRLRYLTYGRRPLAEVYPNIHAGFPPHTDDDGDSLPPSSAGSSFSNGKSSTEDPDEGKDPGNGKPAEDKQSPRGTKRPSSPAGPADSKRPKHTGDSVRTTRQRGQSAAEPIAVSGSSESDDERDPDDFTMQYSEEEKPDVEMSDDEDEQPHLVAAKRTPVSSFIRFPSPKAKGGRYSRPDLEIDCKGANAGRDRQGRFVGSRMERFVSVEIPRLADAETTEDEGDGVALRSPGRRRRRRRRN